MTDGRLRPTPLELAVGTMLGDDPGAPPLPDVSPTLTPLAALEALIRPALERAPCVVSLSGGRDSSAVLAVATSLARREGLPLPIALSVRFRNAPGTSEPEWQELVVRHLALPDWEVVEVADELDLVGERAQRVLLRHGVLYPPSLPLYDLLAERTAGGSLLTGYGGDSILGGWRFGHPADVLAGRARPERGDLALLAYAAAPRGLRRAVMRRRAPERPWLRPEAARLAAASFAGGASREALRFSTHVDRARRRRNQAAAVWSVEIIARGHGAAGLSPLLDPLFAAALARVGGARGFGGRTALMRALFGHLLPAELLTRADKARFAYAYFRDASRAFAHSWNGAGADPDLVDRDALRAAWLALMPHGGGAMPLQAAWLASA